MSTELLTSNVALVYYSLGISLALYKPIGIGLRGLCRVIVRVGNTPDKT